MKQQYAAIQFVVADDDAIIRDNLVPAIVSASGFTLVKLASHGQEVLAFARHNHIDICLLDVDMPVMNGLQCLQELSVIQPSCVVVMLTGFENNTWLEKALLYGARGFITKETPPDLIADYLHQALHGKHVLSSGSIQQAISIIRQGSVIKDELDDFTRAIQSLSPREKDVFALIVTGRTNNAIAARLHIKETTVKTHVTNILKQTKVQSRVMLIKQFASLQIDVRDLL